MIDNTERARRYLAKMESAIAGQGGHAITFKAACKLVEFGLGLEAAWPIFLEWNQTHCQPPWTEADLRHKLQDAFRRARPKVEYGQKRELASPGPAIAAAPPADLRPVLPPITPGTPDQWAFLAKLRGLSKEGVQLAARRGLLWFGEYRSRAAWLVTDRARRNAQARRLDGHPWAQGVKAWTLKCSSAAWPVGINEAAAFPILAVCEGGPDLLAAHHFITVERRETDCAAVAVLGGMCAIHPDALPLFNGKRVRIFPHLDKTGNAAVARWAAQLASAGADVDAFSLAGLCRADGQPVKDLCDAAQMSAEDFDNHECLSNFLP